MKELSFSEWLQESKINLTEITEATGIPRGALVSLREGWFRENSQRRQDQIQKLKEFAKNHPENPAILRFPIDETGKKMIEEINLRLKELYPDLTLSEIAGNIAKEIGWSKSRINEVLSFLSPPGKELQNALQEFCRGALPEKIEKVKEKGETAMDELLNKIEGLEKRVASLEESLKEKAEIKPTPILTEAKIRTEKIDALLFLLHEELRWFVEGSAESREILRQNIVLTNLGYLGTLLAALGNESDFKMWKAFTNLEFKKSENRTKGGRRE